MRTLFCMMVIAAPFSFSAHKQEVFTNPTQSDGFGSQFQSIIAAVIYADLHHRPFVYTPFQSMEHNYDNDPYFIAKKEWLINFIGNFTTINEINRSEYTIISGINYKSFVDKHADICARSKALQKVKNIFRANKNRADYFDNNHRHIVIHTRRPNAQDNRIAGTDIPDTLFLQIIEKLRACHAAKKPLFHIYSQGEQQNFEIFASPDVIIHLNDSVEDAFTAMVLADALVISPSSFSYAAALLSEGEIFYIPFWHNPLPHWVSIDTLT